MSGPQHQENRNPGLGERRPTPFGRSPLTFAAVHCRRQPRVHQTISGPISDRVVREAR